jgi:acyl-CoA synthetase (AMP-forming)/AMP-acid ligase II
MRASVDRTRWTEASPIGDLLVRSAAEHPDRDALVFPAQRVTYAELLAGARHVARGLLAVGVRPGEHVALLAPNGVEYVEAFFAVSLIGGVVVPLNARHRAEELGHVIDDGDIVALLTTDTDGQHSDLAGALRQGLPSLGTAADAGELRLPSSSRGSPARASSPVPDSTPSPRQWTRPRWTTCGPGSGSATSARSCTPPARRRTRRAASSPTKR